MSICVNFDHLCSCVIKLIGNFVQDNATSLETRVKKTDAREIESFYKQYYEHYVVALNKGDKADRYPYINLFSMRIIHVRINLLLKLSWV